MSMATFSSYYYLHLLSSLTYSSCSTSMIESLNVTGTTSLSHQYPRKPQLLSPLFHYSVTFGPRIKLQPPNLYAFLKGDPVPCDQYAENGFIFYSREKPSGRSFTVQSFSSLNEIEELFSKPLEGRDLDLEQYSAVPFLSIKAAKRVMFLRHGQSTWMKRVGSKAVPTSQYLPRKVDASKFIIDGHYLVRDLWAYDRTCWNKILAHDIKSVFVVAHNAVNQALVATTIDSKFPCGWFEFCRKESQ